MKSLPKKINAKKQSFSEQVYPAKYFYMQPTDSVEVTNIIKKIRKRTNSGDDEISVAIVEKIAYSMPALINKIIETGIYPKIFKNSTFIPIYKNGNKLDPNNYLSISLTSNINKITEKIIKTD